jgi:hypothetical protein
VAQVKSGVHQFALFSMQPGLYRSYNATHQKAGETLNSNKLIPAYVSRPSSMDRTLAEAGCRPTCSTQGSFLSCNRWLKECFLLILKSQEFYNLSL